MAVQLIRNLSTNDLAPGMAAVASPTQEPPRSEAEQAPVPAQEPLLLQEGARAADGPDNTPEFHTIRLDVTQPADIGDPPQWLADIERLEANARQAVETLTKGRDGPETPPKDDPDLRPETGPETHEEAPPATTAAPHPGLRQEEPVAETPPEAPVPGPDDEFSPRLVANADIQPEDGDPGVEDDRSISEGMDINRRAIEQAAADSSQNLTGHDYLAMEDKAIDRLLETTNALLENDDHTRKNQSLDRLKAAVVATEAERRISVKTATGTVTLDFDEKGSTRRPVADLLAAPKIDPEKRRQRLQDYREMIAEHKKRP